MQKVSHFWAQIKKKRKMSVTTFLPRALQFLHLVSERYKYICHVMFKKQIKRLFFPLCGQKSLDISWVKEKQ